MGKVKQNLDFFHMPVELEVQTEGNPEFKTIQVSGTESDFDLEVFGRPKPNGIILDPHNYILKSSERLHVRAVIARGEALAEQGRFYDAIQQYSQALDLQKNNSLADFRIGEAFFYQKNYSAAANAFRDALDGDLDRVTSGWKSGRTSIWGRFTTSPETARAPSTSTAKPSRPTTTPAARRTKPKST